MSSDVTGEMQTLLQSFLGLYGAGHPADGADSSEIVSVAARASSPTGNGINGYDAALGMQAAIADAHANRDSLVRTAVAAAGDSTVTGRSRMADQIAEFQTRVQAIASVADTRFSAPALLSAAQLALGGAVRQVDADVAAAQRQAAQIIPPAVPASVVAPRPRHSRRRNRPRRRLRSRSQAGPRLQAFSDGPQPGPRFPALSDGTAGGRAVSAAKGWADARTPYVWGGGNANGPTGGGFDCSGLTQYAIAQATDGQVVLPRTTYDQIYSGVRVDPSEVRAGDLVFPADSFDAQGPGHVQLAAGSGWVIEAPNQNSHVKWSRMPREAVVIRVL